MSTFLNSHSLTRHIEALEAKMMIPTGKKTYAQINPFLVDHVAKPKKKSEKKDPLSLNASLTATETEMKLNTINDFYGDSDDEEYGDMESVEHDDDTGLGGNDNGSVSKYYHRKNNFHFYRRGSTQTRSKLYYAQRALLVKCIFAVCMFIMMSGVLVSHKSAPTGTGKGADFVPASASDYLPDDSKDHEYSTSSKSGEGKMSVAEQLDKEVEEGETTKSIADQLENEVEEDELEGDKALKSSRLPDGWREYTDKQTGKPYYSDPLGHVTWTRPSTSKVSHHESSSSEGTGSSGSIADSTSGDSVDNDKSKSIPAETSKLKSKSKSSSVLPDGWREYTDKKTGKSYYMDPEGNTSWERPPPVEDSSTLSLEATDSSSSGDAAADPASLPPLPMGWREYSDSKSGKSYYMDPHGKTTWKRPSVFEQKNPPSHESGDSEDDVLSSASKSGSTSIVFESGSNDMDDSNESSGNRGKFSSKTAVEGGATASLIGNPHDKTSFHQTTISSASEDSVDEEEDDGSEYDASSDQEGSSEEKDSDDDSDSEEDDDSEDDDNNSRRF